MIEPDDTPTSYVHGWPYASLYTTAKRSVWTTAEYTFRPYVFVEPEPMAMGGRTTGLMPLASITEAYVCEETSTA